MKLMDFQFYLEKLYSSKEYMEFKSQKKKDLFFCGGFLSIERENVRNPRNVVHIDYYVPAEKKVYSFKMDGDIVLIAQDNPDSRVPQKMNDNVEFDFDDIIDLAEKELVDKQINNTIKKAVLSLQSLKGKDYLIGTLFLNNMALARIRINLEDMKIEELEKKGFFDILKRG
jgi:hypothetical protein